MPSSAKGAHYPEMRCSRTTNPPRAPAARCRRLCAVVAVAALACAGAARATLADLHVSLSAASLHAPALPPNLDLVGHWPDSCVPTVERVTLDGFDLGIRLRSPPGPCQAVETPLRLTVNPARAAGLDQLPGGIYRVAVRLARKNGPDPLLAFRLVDASARFPSPRPENGFWWASPANGTLAGSGINLEVQGERLAVTLLGRDAIGLPTWYFGSATLERATAHVPLLRIGAGDPAAAAGASTPGPVLDLQFDGPADATAYLSVDDDGDPAQRPLDRLTLQRVPFEPGRPGSPWRGRWVLLRDGEASARVLDFAAPASTPEAERFRLVDDGNGAVLDCRLGPRGADAPPQACTLASPDLPAVEFDQVGLDRLDGHALDGIGMQLLRIPR